MWVIWVRSHRGGVVTSPNPPPPPPSPAAIQLEANKKGEDNKSHLGGDNVKEGDNSPVQGKDNLPGCQHKRGGFCLKHGGGAKKHEKIIFKDIVGPDGKMRKKKSKKVYYVCDVAQNGSKLK